jgi:MFS family permease
MPATHSPPAQTPAPSHQQPPQPGWRLDTFRSLRHKNYRLYFSGQLISVLGSWVQITALAWLAYDRTKESKWTALIAAVQMAPTAVLGAWGGSLADRVPKRLLIFVAQSGLLGLSLVLAGLVYAGLDTRWTLLAVAVAIGLVNAIDLPARLAFVIDLVGREDLPNAVALNSLLFNVARATGPALGALLLGWLGPAPCFLFNGLTFLAVLAALAWMDVPAPPPVEKDRGALAGLLDGFAVFRRQPRLLLLLALSGVLSLLVWPTVSLLPAVSADQLGRGPDGYGSMLSAFGGGALLAALLAASFGPRVRRRWFLGGGLVVMSAALVGLGSASDLSEGVECCVAAGAGLIAFFVTAQSVVQLSATDGNRGRVMGVWSMVTSGAMPVGNLLVGCAADVWGVGVTLTAMGLTALGIAALLALATAARRQGG